MRRDGFFVRRWCLLAALPWLLSAAAAAGCGRKSDSEEKGTPAGGSAGASAGSDSGGTEPTGMAGQPGPGLGGFPALDAAVADCVSCITETCPGAQACFEDPSCVQGAICAAETCVANQDAGLELDCWLGCFEGDPAAGLTAFTAFTCVANSCGMDCAGALGG